MSGALAGRWIKPMKAASGELPTGDEWVYELKWDGMRIVAMIDDDGLRLTTTNQLAATASFPELDGLVGLGEGLESLIIDGEVVAFGDDGRPNFGRLQGRMHVKDPTEAKRRSIESPVSFVIFDVLHVNGNDLFEVPFGDRRRLLEQLVEPGEHWRLTDVHEGDAAALLDVVTEQGLEGLIAKQRTSRYLEGKRSPSWRKIKPRRRQEFVVGGWAEGKESRSGSVGSLLIGYYVDGELRHCGSVGSGLDGEGIKRWDERAVQHAVDTSPFDRTGSADGWAPVSLAGASSRDRSGVRRVDQRRPCSPSELPWRSCRQGPDRCGPRELRRGATDDRLRS